eukprot:COSAG02_NODE_2768_length_8063_cov_17.175163_1_plen_122_part_00
MALKQGPLLRTKLPCFKDKENLEILLQRVRDAIDYCGALLAPRFPLRWPFRTRARRQEPTYVCTRPISHASVATIETPESKATHCIRMRSYLVLPLSLSLSLSRVPRCIGAQLGSQLFLCV